MKADITHCRLSSTAGKLGAARDTTAGGEWLDPFVVSWYTSTPKSINFMVFLYFMICEIKITFTWIKLAA